MANFLAWLDLSLDFSRFLHNARVKLSGSKSGCAYHSTFFIRKFENQTSSWLCALLVDQSDCRLLTVWPIDQSTGRPLNQQKPGEETSFKVYKRHSAASSLHCTFYVSQATNSGKKLSDFYNFTSKDQIFKIINVAQQSEIVIHIHFGCLDLISM